MTDSRDGLANAGVDEFEGLLEAHGRWLFGRLCSMVGSIQLAEDLLQSTFVAAYSSRHAFTPGTSIRAWLHRIGSNLAKNARRDGRREVTGVSETDSPDPETPERTVLTLELRDRIDEALEQLDPERRAVAVMRDIEGLSYAEIAREVGSTEGAVRVRVHRARQQLQELLRPYLDPEQENER